VLNAEQIQEDILPTGTAGVRGAGASHLVPAAYRARFREAERTIAVPREALEEYACPGRGACPVPWNSSECFLGAGCGIVAENALSYKPDTPFVRPRTA
jgi:hypothetical protein